MQRSRAAVLLHYRELKVKEITDLRNRLRTGGNEIELQVAKNTLLRIAANNAGKPGLEGLFTGPTAIAFIYGEEPQGRQGRATPCAHSARRTSRSPAGSSAPRDSTRRASSG